MSATARGPGHTRSSIEQRYDATIAERMLSSAHTIGGLPAYLGIELLRYSPGRLEAVATVSDDLITPSGNVHGGVLAATLDHVTGAAVYPLMPDGWWGATAELKLNYVSPTPSGRLDVVADVLAMSNRSAVVRGEVLHDGRLLCAAQGTVSLVAPRPPADAS